MPIQSVQSAGAEVRFLADWFISWWASAERLQPGSWVILNYVWFASNSVSAFVSVVS